MSKTEKLLIEIKQLDAECQYIMIKAKSFDSTHGRTWFTLVFGVLPILLSILSHSIFDTPLYHIIQENLDTFFIGTAILIAIFFYTKYKSSEEYDKLIAKKNKSYSLKVFMKNFSQK